MTNSPSFEDLNKRLLEIQRSPEYQQACQRFQSECDRLSTFCSNLQIQELIDLCVKNTTRTELASGSTLHRGFYCPSPIYDLIVGNVKRGRVIKSAILHQKPSHEYGFDADGRLLWCKTLHNEAVAHTEYLLHQDDHIFGIMVDSNGHVITITEETYENRRIVSYLHGLCFLADISELHSEYYTYDDQGLCAAQWHTFMPIPDYSLDFLQSKVQLPQHPIYKCDKYRFEQKDGYLSSYTTGKHIYKVRTKRKV